nr:MAG TPA: hypothetical protein [Bacteriophage sp.]
MGCVLLFDFLKMQNKKCPRRLCNKRRGHFAFPADGGVCLSARKQYSKWVWQRNAQIGEMGSILPNQI